MKRETAATRIIETRATFQPANLAQNPTFKFCVFFVSMAAGFALCLAARASGPLLTAAINDLRQLFAQLLSRIRELLSLLAW